jgi:hypothetical protein
MLVLMLNFKLVCYMKTFKNIFIKPLAVSLLFMFAACADYLDIMPDNVATMEHAFSNRNVTNKFLFSCYNYMPNPVSLTENPALVGGDENWWCLDEWVWGLQYRTTNAAYLAQGLQNANDPYLNYWDGARNGKNLFIGIRDCNIFLENIHVPTDIEEDERSQWTSEVKVLKAYFHFYLLRNYGPIPVTRENIPVDVSEVSVYREPVDNAVDYIVELIDEAMPGLLPQSFATRGEDAGRITRPIAAAIKAQALVWAASPLLNGSEQEMPSFSLIDNRGVQLFPQEYEVEKWVRAARAIREAIDICHENGHRLYEYQNYNTALSDTTRLKCVLRGAVTEKYNPEIVWPSTQSTQNLEYNVSPYFDMIYAETATSEFGATLKIAEQFYTHNGLPVEEDEEWISWAGGINRRYEPAVNSGTGMDGNSLSGDHRFLIQSNETSAKLHFYREPRFYAWIGFDRGIWEMNGKGEAGRFLKARGGELHGVSNAGRHNTCGYVTKKLVNMETVQNTNGALTQTRYTYPVIRLTDLYLLYAEALNESKAVPDSEVYQWIDLVRLRAGIPGVLEAYKKAVSSQKNKPATKSGMREIIKRERLIELSFESQRFYDLIRWKDAYQHWNEPVQGWNINGRTVDTYYQVTTYFAQRVFNQRDYFWPLKLGSLQVNRNLVQNPGW